MFNHTSNRTSIYDFGDARCKNSTDEYLDLNFPFDNYCSVTLYTSWNTTKIDRANISESELNEVTEQDRTPLGTLRECCTNAEGEIQFLGPTDCTAVCNVTDGEWVGLQECADGAGPEIRGWHCAGHNGTVDGGVGRLGVPFAGGDGVGGVGGYLALAVVVGYVVGVL